MATQKPPKIIQKNVFLGHIVRLKTYVNIHFSKPGLDKKFSQNISILKYIDYFFLELNILVHSRPEVQNSFFFKLLLHISSTTQMFLKWQICTSIHITIHRFRNSLDRFQVAILKDYIVGRLTIVRINQKAILRKSNFKIMRAFLLFKLQIYELFFSLRPATDLVSLS